MLKEVQHDKDNTATSYASRVCQYSRLTHNLLQGNLLNFNQSCRQTITGGVIEKLKIRKQRGEKGAHFTRNESVTRYAAGFREEKKNHLLLVSETGKAKIN